ncbi:MAG TPA: cytochrome c [Vicinamibacterales bacterium]|nr:cytochrome c [Vicinamibacterales bacterium]
MRHHYALAMLILGLGIAVAAQSEDSPKTVWQGVYTEPQAARGEAEYSTHCASCHRDDLSGYNTLLKGQRFMEKYREAPLHLLFDKTKTTMPRNAAGTLSDQAYVDIVAYLLKMNEFPVGSEELTTELLPRIRVIGKGGPQPVPDFALVQVVGCLTPRESDGVWMLTNTTEPVRTGNPQPIASERQAAEALPLGAMTFRLLLSAAYSPALHKGHKVEVRGFLIRRPEGRINVTSLETVNSTCGG